MDDSVFSSPMSRSILLLLVLQVLCGCRVASRPAQLRVEPAEASSPFIVRTAIVIPSDRTLPADAHASHALLIEDMQDFFADQMQRHGHGRITFEHELDPASGLPRLHVVHSSRSSAELAQGTTLEHHNRLIADAIAAGCPVDRPGQSWLILSESWWQQPDGTLDGIVALGIRGRRDGNENNGVGVRSGPVLRVVAEGAMANDAALPGDWWPALGPYPLTLASVPFFAHATRSGSASSIVGSVAHELGHCFGLLHVYENDGMWCGPRQHDRTCVHYGVLMGNGFRAWRSRSGPSSFSSDETPEFIALAAASADMLSISPFFGRSDPASDPSPPELDGQLNIEFDAPQRRLRVRGRASDEQSGIALVQLYNGKETVWSQVFPDRPHTLAIDIETDRLPPRGTGPWRLRIFNGAFQEDQIWMTAVPEDAVGEGLRVHIIPLEHRHTAGEPSRFRPRILRLPAGDRVERFAWRVGDEALSSAEHLVHAFDTPGLHELALSIHTAQGLETQSTMRIWVEQPAIGTISDRAAGTSR